MGPATPPRRQTEPRITAMPPQRPDGAQGTGHAPTAASRRSGDRRRPHDGQTRTRRTATPPWWPDAAQDTGHAPTAARRAQDIGHAPTEAIRSPGHQPRPYNRQTGPRTPETHHVGHTKPRTLAKPPQQPDGAKDIGHAPTVARRVTGHQTRPHGGHMGPRGPATPRRPPYGVQDTGHANTAADRTHYTNHTPTVATRVQETGHTHTAARRGPGHRPRPHGGKTGTRGPATPLRQPDGA